MRVVRVAGHFSDDPLQVIDPLQRHGEQEEDDKGESESLCRFLANTLTNGAVPVEENEAEEVAEPFDAEKKEQQQLRQEYIFAVKNNLRSTLNNIDIKEKDGSITRLQDLDPTRKA